MKVSRELLIVVLIISVAAFFRLYKLEVYPPGLYPDEAMNGNNAIQAIEGVPPAGGYKIFYPENNGREGLFIALQTASIKIFGNTAYALRVVSAIAGVLTVLGTYLLTRKLFNWQIAAISSFALAVSFWHVVFSRIGFRAIMAPLLITYGIYFFWNGLSSARKRSFLISGICWGLGFYTYISFRIMPLALVATLLAYWFALKKDFEHERYIETRNRIVQGLAVFMVTVIIIVLPLAYHFYVHPGDFMGRLTKVSVFEDTNPLLTILKNTGKTLGMFNFIGDRNWRHNISGESVLFWPIGIFAVIGFFKSIFKLERSRQKHGHLSPAHVLLLSWFFLGLLPVILSTEGIPHSLRAIVVIPVVYIFVAEGLWWMFEYAQSWYYARDVHLRHIPFTHLTVHESTVVSAIVLSVFLGSVGAYEFKRYFYDWGPRQEVRDEFNQNYVDIAKNLLALPTSRIKYVLVNRDTGVSVNGIPVTAQTIMYLTDTYTPEKQRAKNIYYLTKEQYARRDFLPNATIFPLEKIK